MAPEIFMSGHRHSFAADYYSLGVTTYQMLAGHRPYKPDAANMKSIVRMSTFIPPDKYTDVAHIRRILVSAQERKAPTPEFRYSVRLAHRASPEAISFIQQCLICNPRYRLGCQGVAEVKAHPWFNGEVDRACLGQRNEPPPLRLPLPSRPRLGRDGPGPCPCALPARHPPR
jgi:serine/threonine protein kinase